LACDFLYGEIKIIMKALLTFTLVLIIGLSAMAQEAKAPVLKPGTPEVAAIHPDTLKSVLSRGEGGEAIARLYRFKNYRVLKELKFTTKISKAKLA